MPAEKRILIATDFSARSDRPLERALLLRQQLGASVLILHVVEGAEQFTIDEEEEHRSHLQEEFGLTTEDAEICFAHGSVPATIAKVAKERGCELIVVGVARYNSPRDFVLGTAVDYLVRQSPVPVLVVKRRPRRPYDRLVVATDYSMPAAEALASAVKLFPDAKVRLVHAYQAAFEAFLEHDSTIPFVRSEAAKRMKDFLAALPDTLQSRVETVIAEGPLATVLKQSDGKLGRELLVLGTWHRRGHAHVLGSQDGSKLSAGEHHDILIVGKAAQNN